MKGLGLQYKASIYSIICIYTISLPATYILGFHPELVIKHPRAKELLGLPGIYLGYSLGMLVLNIIYICMFCTLDWKAHSQQVLMELNAVGNMPKL